MVIFVSSGLENNWPALRGIQMEKPFLCERVSSHVDVSGRKSAFCSFKPRGLLFLSATFITYFIYCIVTSCLTKLHFFPVITTMSNLREIPIIPCSFNTKGNMV